MRNLAFQARILTAEAGAATAGARNEAALRHELEKALERHAIALRIPWIPFRLEVPVKAGRLKTRFIDVAHGGVIIEYESPGAFKGKAGSALAHAQEQASDYAVLLQAEEGRDLGDYVLVAWDGAHICFGHLVGGKPRWERQAVFGEQAAQRLLSALSNSGVPLVHPQLLAVLVGPESLHGERLIPLLFRAVKNAASPEASTTKTLLLYTEWRRLFGQVVGVQSERLRDLLARQGRAHGSAYETDPSAYLFALNTYIAIVAKFVSALSLPRASEDIADDSVAISNRMEALESGQIYRGAGVLNMLSGDFFSWYRDDSSWPELTPHIEALLTALKGLSFDLAKKSPESTRDLFKGMYQSFVPRALRHALGEYYTPDWLAAHALDTLGWTPDQSLLDPTCGSGTFILEALRRRLNGNSGGTKTAETLLAGLYGIDLNPLAVLAARASLVVSLAPFLDPHRPLNLPIYLADAINPAQAKGDVYRHTLQTELGRMQFGIPRKLVEDAGFFSLFSRIRELVDGGLRAPRAMETIGREFAQVDRLTPAEKSELLNTTETLVQLFDKGWDGIWCAVLADRFAAGSIPRVPFIAGNPPWVKWSHLPPEYAEFIKPRCLELGVFSQDRWVGGIESDISTIITYEAIDHWLGAEGRLGFFITGTVFSNESSQGFRRFELPSRNLALQVTRVEDFSRIAPFDGVSNHATLLLLLRDHSTRYPIPYLVWNPPRVDGSPVRSFRSADSFRERATADALFAEPVPGTDAGPWLKGSHADHQIWKRIFSAGSGGYTARKGVTTDRNGIFFVKILGRSGEQSDCRIENDPGLGRSIGIPRVQAIIEHEHLFPLLRGRGVQAFRVSPDPSYHLLLPQRGMHGDPDLPDSSPLTHRFLRRFKSELEQRSSYRRFQRGQVWWSIWSTGPYTFSPYKVFWREMAGGRFVAAYAGSIDDPVLGRRVLIPDHKVYFVPVESLEEAAYLTAFLNAPLVSRAISSYAAQLSLGVSVVEYLAVQSFDSGDPSHLALSSIGRALTEEQRQPSDSENAKLDALALAAVAR